MTELMETLFLYAQEHRFLTYCNQETAYRESRHAIDRQETLLREALSKEQAHRLDDLMSELHAMQWIELEAMFQAGFSIAVELGR